MSPLTVKAFLFDMDGTLVDSTAVINSILKDFSSQFGLNEEEVIAYAHGRQTIDTVTHFIGAGAEAQTVSDQLTGLEINTLDGVVAVPGAQELLNTMPNSAWALVTSAGRELAVNRMKAAGLALPATLICAEDVSAGKPDPAPYLLGSQKLGRPIEDCPVLEDATAGIKSGIASGAHVVVVDENAEIEGLGIHCVCKLSDLRITQNHDEFVVSFSARED